MIRDTITEDQFSMYLEIETTSRADEWGVTAYGVLAAIQNAFGAKDAVKKYARSLRPKKAEGGTVAELRRRMGKLVALGMVKQKGP